MRTTTVYASSRSPLGGAIVAVTLWEAVRRIHDGLISLNTTSREVTGAPSCHFHTVPQMVGDPMLSGATV